MIDVCIPTLGTEEELKPVIQSITDSGIEIGNIIISRAESRALARTELIEKANTEWFLLIDSDIIVNVEWANKILKQMKSAKPDVATISGLGLSDSKILNFIRFFLIRIRGTKKQRLFTSNTLVRLSAVKGIILDVPNETHNEDFQLQEKINERGFKCMNDYSAICKHIKKGNKVWNDAFSDFRRIAKQEGLITAIKKI